VGFLYLLLIMILAMTLGFALATVSSLAAVTCLNYCFVPPVLTWRVDDPANWVALFAFEATALVVSRLSTKAQRAAKHGRQQSIDRKRLCDLSRGILLTNRIALRSNARHDKRTPINLAENIARAIRRPRLEIDILLSLEFE